MTALATFEQLISSIKATSRQLAQRAKLAVNTSLTLRNWLIGCYIEEYERGGADRAEYGDGLMDAVAKALQEKGLSHCDRRALYRYRSFYLAYPEIVGSLPPQLLSSGAISLPAGPSDIVGSPAAQSSEGTLETQPPQSETRGERVLTRLSYTHIEQLVRLDDPAKRAFYEDRCIEAVEVVRRQRDDRGRRFAHWPSALHREGPHGGQVRAGGNEQSALCFEVPGGATDRGGDRRGDRGGVAVKSGTERYVADADLKRAEEGIMWLLWEVTE